MLRTVLTPVLFFYQVTQCVLIIIIIILLHVDLIIVYFKLNKSVSYNSLIMQVVLSLKI